MPVRMLSFVSTPPPRKAFGASNGVQKTQEFQDACIALGAGLKPQEYIEVYFPPEHSIFKEVKYPNVALVHLLKKKVKELNLPYDIYEREKHIYIVGRGYNG